MLATGTHVLIRVKDGITLTRTGDFLPDGSYPALICGGGQQLAVRVIEYQVSVAGHDAPELFCLITDLDDHQAYPAGMLAAAYHWRWIGSETTLKEAKSAIRESGPSAGPMLRSATPPLIAQEHAAWVISAELARAIARDAAAVAVPARKGRRAGLPVHPREISFTAARRAIIATTQSGAATASLPARPDQREPGPHPGQPGPVPDHRGPEPAPRPQDQGRARLPARRPAHPHAHRTRPDQRLRHRSLTPHPSRSCPATHTPAVEPAADPERHPGHRPELTQRHHGRSAPVQAPSTVNMLF